MITSHVDPNKGATARMQDLEAEATAFARQNKGATMDNLYVHGQSRGVTKEQARTRGRSKRTRKLTRPIRNQHNAGRAGPHAAERGPANRPAVKEKTQHGLRTDSYEPSAFRRARI